MKKLIPVMFFLSLAFTSVHARAPFPDQYENRKYAFSLAGSFSYSFFSVDKRHSEPASSLLGLGGMFRFHFFVRQNIHMQLGLELLSQKCKFNTYYFADGHSDFYDESFGYTHRLRTYELYIPIIARIGPDPQETNAPAAFYFLAGYAPKIFLSATALVTENETGKDVWGGSTELQFENWFINDQTSSVIMAGIGLDKRFGWTTNYMSFELMYRYNFSRFRYQGNQNTNDLMIKNSCVTFQVGYRFQ
jgi:hypothetical protein